MQRLLVTRLRLVRGRAGCPDLHFHDLRHEVPTDVDQAARKFRSGMQPPLVSVVGHVGREGIP